MSEEKNCSAADADLPAELPTNVAIPAKSVQHTPLPLLTTSAALEEARRVSTSGSESPPSCRESPNSSSSHPGADADHVSTVEPSIARPPIIHQQTPSGPMTRHHSRPAVSLKYDSKTLFCHLRHAEHSALRDDVLGSDLGHVDHLLKHQGVDEPEDFHQLAHRLRHKNVERRDGHNRLQHGLHGALPNPFLWLWRLCQAWQAVPRRALLHTAEEHPLGRRSLPDLGREVQLAPPPRPWPSSVPVGLSGG